MARLTRCAACGGAISRRARACPACGEHVNRLPTSGVAVVLILFLLLAWLLVAR